MQTSNHAALSRFVARLQLNSVLSEAEQQAVMGLRSHATQYGQGRDFVRPGDTITHATLVVAGNAGRFDLMRNGSRQITAIYIAGDMCDLYSVAMPTAGWGLTSLGTSTVLQIPHSDMRDLAFTYPNLALAFWRDTVLDASILAKWIANVGRKDARARIAHLLCELGTRNERAGLGKRDEFELALTQEQIADAMGLTSVHVNRMLQSLRVDDLVSMRAHRVTIKDWDHLASIADFTPTFLLCDGVGHEGRSCN
jgi:CRP-like cAMP-binding protein